MPWRATIPPRARSIDRGMIPALHEAQDQAARIQLRAYRSNIITSDSVASRALLKSIGIREVMRTESKRIKSVGSDLIQALIMEDGRARNRKPPPVQAILEWMPFRGLGNSRSRAFAIAITIGRRGIRGRKLLRDAFEGTKDEVVRTFQRAVERYIARTSA